MKAHIVHPGRSYIALLCISALLALPLSSIIVRFPKAWWLVPTWPTELLMNSLQPSGQEAAADVEFLGIWVVCSCAIGAVWAAVVVLRKFLHGGSANGHVV